MPNFYDPQADAEETAQALRGLAHATRSPNFILEAQIEAGTLEYEQAQAHLEDCLALAGDCHAIYMSIDDSLRRTANQAFFEKLYITEADAVDGEAGEPLDILFNREVHFTALRRQNGGADQSGNQTANVAGLNKDQLVPPAGIEPAAFGTGNRRSIP